MMFGSKDKKQPVQGRRSASQTSQQTRQAKPTFSYYANRPPDVSQPRRKNNERVVPDKSIRLKRKPTRIPATRLLYWFLAVIVVVCIAKLAYLGTNPKLVVLGKSSVTNSYVQAEDTYTQFAQKLLASSVTSHTKLTVNVNGTAAALRTEYPELRSVSVALPLIGNKPIVYIEVAPPSVVLQTGSANYALNGNGLVLAKLTALPGGVPALTDQSQAATPQIGKQFLPSGTISFISILAAQFKAAAITPSVFVLPPASPFELDVRMQGAAYLLRFNLQADATQQSGAAIGAIKQVAAAEPASYIDVRVPGRVYYK